MKKLEFYILIADWRRGKRYEDAICKKLVSGYRIDDLTGVYCDEHRHCVVTDLKTGLSCACDAKSINLAVENYTKLHDKITEVRNAKGYCKSIERFNNADIIKEDK